MAAALLGGGVRVGFENNLWLPDGTLAESNASLVSVARDVLIDLGYRPATANELRAQE